MMNPAAQPLAADRRRIRPPSLVRVQRLVDVPTRWTLLALGAWVLWRTRDAGAGGGWLWLMAVYGLLALLSTAYWLIRPQTTDVHRADAGLAYGLYVADAVFVSALIWRDGGISSPLFILLVLLALKAVTLTPSLPGMVWMPFLFGPCYTAALRLAASNFGFLADNAFQTRYILLWAWLVGLVLVAWELARRTAEAVEMDAALTQQQVALAQKTETLQRTATDLGDRVLELRALQEVSKALATTLRTEETLQLVLENLCSVTGSSHCAVALVEAGRDDGMLNGASFADGDEQAQPFIVPLVAEPAVREALRTGRLVHVTASLRNEEGRSKKEDLRRGNGDSFPPSFFNLPSASLGTTLGGHPYIVTPLISRGQPIGTLLVAENASRGPRGKLNVTEQLLTSFAYFAATALENARLYQDAWEKRRELEAVLAGIGDGVVVVDPEMALILMNPVARDILGLEAEPPAGVPLRPYLSVSAFVDLLAETMQSGQEQIRELDLPCPGKGDAQPDECRIYGILSSPVLDAEGQVGGVVAVLRDVTVQKELERMKSNFLSVVSHELRTPLHSIKGFVEIILMGKTGPVSELQEDFLKTVRTQTLVLQRMIDDLLEFSRMEAGRVRLHLAEVSLPAMARSVNAKLAPLAEEDGLRLTQDLPDDLPEIDGDRTRLEQVLTNLVENAIKFTPGGGEVVISGKRVDDRVRLTVADSGIGIPPDEQEKVFDRFYQVDGSERRAYRGAGLGLSICRHIVERHNGRIWVESEGVAGCGSRFHVELPIKLQMDEAPTIDFTTPSRVRRDG
jgi:signal transduction histidine kinase